MADGDIRLCRSSAVSAAAAALNKIVQTHGPEIVYEQRRVEGLLRDFVVPAGREVRLLLQVLKNGYAQQLLDSKDTVTAGLIPDRIVRSLHDEIGMDLGAARWAVDIWVAVLEPGGSGGADGDDEQAIALLALEDEMRSTAESVRMADMLGTGHRRRIRAGWARVTSLRDAAVAAGRASPLGTDEPAAEIEVAREAIRRFRAAHAAALDAADSALAALPRLRQEARTALVDARLAVQRTDGVGARSRRATERLAEAEQAAARLDAAGIGLAEQCAAARHVLDLARSVTGVAAEAPRTQEQVRTSLASITIRLTAATDATKQVRATMSALRREFADACSRDLADVETQRQHGLAAADRAVVHAGGLAAAGEWDDAAEQINSARSALAGVEQLTRTVQARLDTLREVRADPARSAADTRFVLHDARLLVADHRLSAEFGRALDVQAERLESATRRLSGTHPDYWRYLRELCDVRDQVKNVVHDVRIRVAERSS